MTDIAALRAALAEQGADADWARDQLRTWLGARRIQHSINCGCYFWIARLAEDLGRYDRIVGSLGCTCDVRTALATLGLCAGCAGPAAAVVHPEGDWLCTQCADALRRRRPTRRDFRYDERVHLIVEVDLPDVPERWRFFCSAEG